MLVPLRHVANQPALRQAVRELACAVSPIHLRAVVGAGDGRVRASSVWSALAGGDLILYPLWVLVHVMPKTIQPRQPLWRALRKCRATSAVTIQYAVWFVRSTGAFWPPGEERLRGPAHRGQWCWPCLAHAASCRVCGVHQLARGVPSATTCAHGPLFDHHSLTAALSSDSSPQTPCW